MKNKPKSMCQGQTFQYMEQEPGDKKETILKGLGKVGTAFFG